MEDPPPTHQPCCVCKKPGGKHCTQCKSRHYCSKKCQLVDWKERGHKAQCRQMTVEFQDRLLDEAKKPKEEPAIVADVSPADDFKTARLSAVPTAKADEAGAIKGDASDWRGTCAICLDLLPIDGAGRTFYSCCCKSICTACFVKCRQHDKRCPLCRAPASKSPAESLRWLQKHVDNGNADAQVMLGDKYRDGKGLEKSLERAFELYQLASAQGLARAQLRLGYSYVHGRGVEINYKTAAQWYRRAAEQGYPLAQSNLGYMYDNGKGVAQSHDDAVKWYRLAAAQGDANGLYILGACYENGLGVPRDDHEALHLYKRAAAKGHAEAAKCVDKVAARLALDSRHAQLHTARVALKQSSARLDEYAVALRAVLASKAAREAAQADQCAALEEERAREKSLIR
jgi:TPR repeat protein